MTLYVFFNPGVFLKDDSLTKIIASILQDPGNEPYWDTFFDSDILSDVEKTYLEPVYQNYKMYPEEIRQMASAELAAYLSRHPKYLDCISIAN